MENIPVSFANKAEENIYIRQVGKNENSYWSLPSAKT